jgi:hypothetical protein
MIYDTSYKYINKYISLSDLKHVKIQSYLDYNEIVCSFYHDILSLNELKNNIKIKRIIFKYVNLDKLIWDDKFSELTELYIYNCSFNHLNITKYVSLERLVINNTNLSKLSNICEYDDINLLHNLIDLKYLDISNNNINNINKLFALNLKYLDVSNNPIKYIKFKYNNYTLGKLVINSLNLTRINFINKLKKIYEISCDGNKNRINLYGLYNSNIIKLSLSDSCINYISFNKNFKNLIYLDISNNCIEQYYINLYNLSELHL